MGEKHKSIDISSGGISSIAGIRHLPSVAVVILVIACACLAVAIRARRPPLGSFNEILSAREDPFLLWYAPTAVAVWTLAAVLAALGGVIWWRTRSPAHLALAGLAMAVLAATGIALFTFD